MPNLRISPHEALEIHELLALKNKCALKASNFTGMVADPKLRVMLETDLKKSQQHIKDLRDLIQQTEYGIQNQEEEG